MAWIPMIQEEKAEAELKEMVRQIARSHGRSLNSIMKIHSLNLQYSEKPL